MAGRSRTTSRAKKDDTPASHVVRPFEYKAIGPHEKKRVLEMRLQNMEAEHYGLAEQRDVVVTQAELRDEDATELVKQYDEQLALSESMIRAWREKLADVNAEIADAATKTEEDEG